MPCELPRGEGRRGRRGSYVVVFAASAQIPLRERMCAAGGAVRCFAVRHDAEEVIYVLAPFGRGVSGSVRLGGGVKRGRSFASHSGSCPPASAPRCHLKISPTIDRSGVGDPSSIRCRRTRVSYCTYRVNLAHDTTKSRWIYNISSPTFLPRFLSHQCATWSWHQTVIEGCCIPPENQNASKINITPHLRMIFSRGAILDFLLSPTLTGGLPG